MVVFCTGGRYFVVGIYNIPLNIACLVNVYIRPRDWLGPFVVGQVGLLVLAYLQFQCSLEAKHGTTCEVPAEFQQVIAAFVATSVAMGVEYMTELPSAVSVIPVLFIFAPGSSAVLSAIGRIREGAGASFVNRNTLWEDIAIAAVTYMIGIYVAQELWKPLITYKLKMRVRECFKAKGSGGGEVRLLSPPRGRLASTCTSAKRLHCRARFPNRQTLSRHRTRPSPRQSLPLITPPSTHGLRIDAAEIMSTCGSP